MKNFTNHEKNVANYILTHMDEIPDISAGELAKASLTSKATVVRLSQKLGLSGYQELKLKLIAEVNQNERIGQILVDFRKVRTQISSTPFRDCMTRRSPIRG